MTAGQSSYKDKLNDRSANYTIGPSQTTARLSSKIMSFTPGMLWLGLALAQPSQPSLELAIAEAAPEGVPVALLPLYKIVSALVQKTTSRNISGLTSKAMIVMGSIAGAKFLWDYFKARIVRSITSSVAVPDSHYLYRSLETYLVNNSGAFGKRHLKLSSL